MILFNSLVITLPIRMYIEIKRWLQIIKYIIFLKKTIFFKKFFFTLTQSFILLYYEKKF